MGENIAFLKRKLKIITDFTEGLNRRRVRQLTELLRHQSSPKLDVDVMLNIWHLNGQLRHPEQSQAWRLQHATYMASQTDTETIEAAESANVLLLKRHNSDV
ncbi:hypothetical protein TNCV_2805471 [Trichonephila clavipes]|nr:hypothetical protein TNCV_2805471 [Trichonephila clavipes]